jgi:hypothetical protein
MRGDLKIEIGKVLLDGGDGEEKKTPLFAFPSLVLLPPLLD